MQPRHNGRNLAKMVSAIIRVVRRDARTCVPRRDVLVRRCSGSIEYSVVTAISAGRLVYNYTVQKQSVLRDASGRCVFLGSTR